MLGYFETKNDAFSKTLFEFFWTGKFHEAYSFFLETAEASRNTRWWSISDLGNAFVSAAVSNNDIAPVLGNYPPPLEAWELPLVVKHQRGAEATRVGRPSGLLSQPMHINKALFAAALGLERGAKHFVETGTYCGTSCYLLAKCFESLVTIEAQPYLHQAAQLLYRRANLTNVTAVAGNSAQVLATLDFRAPPEAVAFFLDAHYSFGPTSQDFGTCPLLDELKILFERFNGATVIVDDMRCMVGQNGYPTINQILDLAPPDYVGTIQYDQLMLCRG
jgi:hypothetical protein